MKRWLLISACCNAVLAGLILGAGRAEAPPPTQPLRLEAIPRVIRTGAPTNASLSPVVVEVVAPFHWSELESAEYREYMENLRAIGCPEKTIRNILLADVNDLYVGRVRELVDGVTGQFWSLMLDREGLEKLVEEKHDQLQQLDDEREELLQALLNDPDVEASIRREQTMTNALAEFRETLDFLSEDKFAAVTELRDRASSARSALQAHYHELGMGAEYQEKLEEVTRQEQAELGALLTEAEFQEYKLRTDKGADVRFRLADFEASEDEVRAIAASKSGPHSQEELRLLLGADRYAALQRSMDPVYQQTLKITDRFELPSKTAVEIYQMQKDAEAMARSIRQDPSRTVAERKLLLEAIQEETERSLWGVLGVKAYKTYQKYGGDWLTRFADEVK